LKKHLFKLLILLFVMLILISSGTALYYQTTGSQFDPIKEIQKLQSQNRRDEALDLVQFYEENKTIDPQKLKEIKADLEYTIVEKFKSIAMGAVTGRVYDTFSGIGAIVSDFFVWGDIRDLGIQSWRFFNNEKTDAIVAVLSGVGIFLSVKPYADVSVSFAKNSIKYFKRILSFGGNNFILKQLLKGKLSLKESKLVFKLLKRNKWSIPRTTAILSNIRNIKYLETATDIISKFKNTGRVFINLTGDAGLFLYSTIPKRLRTIYLKGFSKNPIAFLGITKSHLIIHSLKILKKYNLAGLMVPFMGLSLLLSLLPPYVVAVIFILSAGYMVFIISMKLKLQFKKGELQNA
jgi:hypothetical protein